MMIRPGLAHKYHILDRANDMTCTLSLCSVLSTSMKDPTIHPPSYPNQKLSNHLPVSGHTSTSPALCFLAHPGVYSSEVYPRALSPCHPCCSWPPQTLPATSDCILLLHLIALVSPLHPAQLWRMTLSSLWVARQWFVTIWCQHTWHAQSLPGPIARTLDASVLSISCQSVSQRRGLRKGR